jgi:hypothetical protein
MARDGTSDASAVKSIDKNLLEAIQNSGVIDHLGRAISVPYCRPS